MENVLDIIDALAHEKGLSPESVKGALKNAFIKTAQRLINEDFAFAAEIDEETKSIRVYQTITVVDDLDDDNLYTEEGDVNQGFISLTRAREEVDPDVDIGDEFQIEHDIESHGRTAAMTLYREIEYHVQRLVEDELYNKYKEKIGTIVNGRVTRVDDKQTTYIEMD